MIGITKENYGFQNFHTSNTTLKQIFDKNANLNAFKVLQ